MVTASRRIERGPAGSAAAAERVQRQSRRGSTLSRPLRKELREQAALLGVQRDRVCCDLMELIELAEMPVEYMGSA